jgi:hypothetical protein
MLFVTVQGLPRDTQPELIYALREELILIAHNKMNLPRNNVRVFLNLDMIEASTMERGSNAILVQLQTALFNSELQGEEPQQLTKVLAEMCQTIWFDLRGLIQVEGFVTILGPTWTWHCQALPPREAFVELTELLRPKN